MFNFKKTNQTRSKVIDSIKKQINIEKNTDITDIEGWSRKEQLALIDGLKSALAAVKDVFRNV